MKTHMVTRYGDLPEIRLRGAWLDDAGFGIGFLLIIEVGKGRIVLRQPTEEEWATIEGRDLERAAAEAEREARRKRTEADAARAVPRAA